MTQSSFPWAGSTIGDCGPYTDDKYSDIWKKLFVHDNSAEGVLQGYLNALLVSNPSGNTIRVASGAALVDGKFFENTADVDNLIATPGAGTNRYDRVVLQKDFAAQTVRIAILTGTPAGSPSVPALTQTDGALWEISLARVYITDAGVITVTNDQEYCHFATPGIERRQGGSAAEWNTEGASNYIPDCRTSQQAGAVSVTLAAAVFKKQTVTFPLSFTGKPLVFVTVFDKNNTSEEIFYYITAITTTTFEVMIVHQDGTPTTATFVAQWLAIGPK